MGQAEYSSYALSDQGRQIAAEPLIAAALGKLHMGDTEPWVTVVRRYDSWRNDSDELMSDMVAELKASTFYEKLSANEQGDVMCYIGRLACDKPDTSWKVTGESPNSSTTLFDSPDVARIIPAQWQDLIVLTGIGALDVIQKRGLTISKYREFGFPNKLSFAQFIGAAAVEHDRSHRHFDFMTSYTKALEPGVDKVVCMGGDIHGDFRMFTQEYYPQGSFDPLDKVQPFAPYGANVRGVTGYHSVEPTLFAGLMAWANKLQIPEKAQVAIFANAMKRALPPTQEDSSNPFMKRTTEHYDTDYRDDLILVQDILEDSVEGHFSLHDGFLSGLHGGQTTIKLDAEGRLALSMEGDKETASANEHEQTTLIFQQNELEDLIALTLAQAEQGHGRTTVQKLLGMIAYRFDPPFREVGYLDMDFDNLRNSLVRIFNN